MLDALLQKRAELRAALETAMTAADGEGGLEALKAAQDAFDANESKIEAVRAAKSRIDKLGKPEARKTTASQVKAEVVEVGANRLADDPKKGFKSPRDFLLTVMDVTKTGRSDERLGLLKATAGSDEQGEYSDPYGGFLVPEAFTFDVKSVGVEADPTAGRTTVVPMTAPVVNIPARVDKNHTSSVSGGLTVSRSVETVSKTASRMQMERIQIQANSLFGLAYATEELLTDSPVSFAAILAAGFNDEFGGRILYEKLHGTGVGEMLGVLNSPAKVEVSKESGQAADTIVYENVLKMRARIWGYSNAIWLANQDTIPQLATLKLNVGTGGAAMWQSSAVEDMPDMLLGRPVFYTEYASTVGDAGDLMLVNFAEYLEGTLQPLQSAESIHVRFLNHERAFKFWLRNGGAPWWRSALTPKKSSATLSPIVTLAARA